MVGLVVGWLVDIPVRCFRRCCCCCRCCCCAITAVVVWLAVGCCVAVSNPDPPIVGWCCDVATAAVAVAAAAAAAVCNRCCSVLLSLSLSLSSWALVMPIPAAAFAPRAPRALAPYSSLYFPAPLRLFISRALSARSFLHRFVERVRCRSLSFAAGRPRTRAPPSRCLPPPVSTPIFSGPTFGCHYESPGVSGALVIGLQRGYFSLFGWLVAAWPVPDTQMFGWPFRSRVLCWDH